MSLSNADLLVIKNELLDNPLAFPEYGDLQNPSDDQQNADALNQVRADVLVDRASVPANAIDLDVDEYSATSQSQRDWLKQVMGGGDVRPAVVRDDFTKVFAAGTRTLASFEAAAKEVSSRAQELLGRGVTVTPSDVANARAAT